MRERITFISGINEAFDPSQLRLNNDTLHITSLNAAREDRLTIGLYELPQELWRALKQCHKIHIRWVSPIPYRSIAPFVSKVSPGLHILFTPQRSRTADLICPLLLKIFGTDIKCASPGETFTRSSATSETFTSSDELQYHALVPSLESVITYIQLKICRPSDGSCQAKTLSLHSADYLDIDFDAISQSLVVTAFRQRPPPPGTWSASIERIGGSGKTEIGILANEDTVEPERISLGGFLTTIGESAQPNPTRFSFPSRHHACPPESGTTYSITFPQPRGLHPILRLTFPSTSMHPPLPTCALHTYIVLPSSIFADKYQLSSALFLSSQNLRSLRSVSGETDLEAPNWVISKWGSILLVELAPPSLESFSPSEWHASIPLHLRYLPPTSNGTSLVSIPWPIVFWACPNDAGPNMSTNPFDRVDLGFESLFRQRTMFYHLQPAQSTVGSDFSEQLVENLQVPVLAHGWDGYVETGTVGCVLVGVLWLIWKLLGQKERRGVLHPKAE